MHRASTRNWSFQNKKRHCKSCIDVIEQENKYQIKGIFDLSDNIDQSILGYKVIGTDNDIQKYISKENYFLVTMGQIGSPDKRLNYLKLNLTTIISPRAYISNSSNIGLGTIVMHDVIINANASVGKNCIINSKALISASSKGNPVAKSSSNFI